MNLDHKCLTYQSRMDEMRNQFKDQEKINQEQKAVISRLEMELNLLRGDYERIEYFI